MTTCNLRIRPCIKVKTQSACLQKDISENLLLHNIVIFNVVRNNNNDYLNLKKIFYGLYNIWSTNKTDLGVQANRSSTFSTVVEL
jgi:hypothetical protein